jgi:hypothetical protein
MNIKAQIKFNLETINLYKKSINKGLIEKDQIWFKQFEIKKLLEEINDLRLELIRSNRIYQTPKIIAKSDNKVVINSVLTPKWSLFFEIDRDKLSDELIEREIEYWFNQD